MSTSRLAEARQFLAACSWSIHTYEQNGKTHYVVYDSVGVPRRNFIPIDRLYDYARGVFDAQQWKK